MSDIIRDFKYLFFHLTFFLLLNPVLSLFSVNKYKCMVYYTMLGVDESETLLLLCRRCVIDVDSPPAHLQSHQSAAHTNNYISQSETLSHILHQSVTNYTYWECLQAQTPPGHHRQGEWAGGVRDLHHGDIRHWGGQRRQQRPECPHWGHHHRHCK